MVLSNIASTMFRSPGVPKKSEMPEQLIYYRLVLRETLGKFNSLVSPAWKKNFVVGGKLDKMGI